MHLLLHTRVAQPPARVLAGFNRSLFEQLAPPFPKTNLLRFDGSHPGDVVDMELVVGPKRWRWTSLIVDEGELPDGTRYFVDEGQQLPAPLRFWRHRHLVAPDARGAGSVITEDITYRTGSRVLDVLLYPAMWAQFSWRKPTYRRVFGRP